MTPSRVRPTGQAAEQPDRNEPVGDPDGQDQAGDPGHAEGSECGQFDLAHGGQLPGHKTYRADAYLVGAPHPVRIVVDIVGADLQSQGNDEREQRVADGEAVGDVDEHRCVRTARHRNGEKLAVRHIAGRRAHHDRNHRRRKCPRARASHPQLQRGLHGRRGNLEKSGLRCSTNALRPSCPSSVM